MPAYLEELTIRLAANVGQLPDEVRRCHVKYLTQAQRADGGFAGREGDSDLYYTGFGLRGLAILGELYGEVAERAAQFLGRKLSGRESIVDLLSLIYGASLLESAAGVDVFASAASSWKVAIADMLQELHRDDGGYAKAAEGRASSTYNTFLVLLCLQLIDAEIPEPEGIIRFLESQRSDEGGFREIRVSKRAGTNPTAAAIATLRMLDALDEETRESTIDFLCEMQTDEGGLRANTRIPISDVLSSFTGMLTLADLGALDELEIPPLRAYVESLQLEAGGFHAALWDDAHDVEYTFYGIGSLALLQEVKELW